MWREWCRRIGLWLAQRGGWSDEPIRESAMAPYREALSAVRSDLHTALNEFRALKARMAITATVSAKVFERAKEIVADAETTLSGGEAKRHAAYARLIKDFPNTMKRELGLAIELVLALKEG